MPKPKSVEPILVRLQASQARDSKKVDRTGKPIMHKEEYYKFIKDAYTGRLLEALGVEPTPELQAFVARHASKHEVEENWSDDPEKNPNNILEPVRSRSQIDFTRKGTVDFNNEGSLPERAKFADLSLPEVDPLVIVQTSNKKEQAKKLQEAKIQRQQLNTELRIQEEHIRASKRASPVLTKEYEKAYRSVVGDDDVCPFLEYQQRIQELELLKQKFILPFACERPSPTGQNGTVLIPWQAPELQAGVNVTVPEEFVPLAQQLIAVKIQAIAEENQDYIKHRFPLKALTTRADDELFEAIRQILVSDESVRLIGLLAHLFYWDIFAHLHPVEKRIPDNTRQSLLLNVQDVWSKLQEPARKSLGRKGEILSKDGPSGVSFVLPCFILALKRGVDHIFRRQYRPIFADETFSNDFRDQLNIFFMQLFDPDCIYANFGALDCGPEAMRLSRKLGVLQSSEGFTQATRILSREYRTTPLMLLLMTSDGGNPSDARTRMLLGKSASDTVLGRMTGLSPREEETSPCARKPCLDAFRRAMLFRVARERISGLTASDFSHSAEHQKSEAAPCGLHHAGQQVVKGRAGFLQPRTIKQRAPHPCLAKMEARASAKAKAEKAKV